MVDYHGPQPIEGLVKFFKLPIFDRVSKITYRVDVVEQVSLEQLDVANLQKLEQIQIRKKSFVPTITPEQTASVEALVPSCRMKSVESAGSAIDLNLVPGSPFACASK